MAMTEENKARLAEIALIKKAETAAMRAEEKRLAELDPHKTCKKLLIVLQAARFRIERILS